MDHGWTFLENQKKLHLLTPNVYKYPFEYVLPGNLVESVDSNSYGSLLYKLKATVDRPAFSPNLIDRHQLRIIRQCTPHFMSSVPLHIHNEWANKIDYKIHVPKRVFIRGEQIPIEFTLTPKTNGPDQMLYVRYLSCFLKEYTSFVLGGTRKTESRVIRFFRDETFPSQGSLWHKTEHMTVPHSFESIQCDVQNEFFKIEHKLKFTMSLINTHGDLAELRASLPIEIINQQVEQQENELPTYENAWRSALYSPPVPYLDGTTPPYSPMEDPYPSTPHHLSATTDVAEDYFGYQPPNSNNNNSDICTNGILPSYQSVIVMNASDNDDGLPEYNSTSY